MTKEREALTLAQEVIQMLGAPSPLHFSKDEIIKWQECNTAIKETLAQPEQELTNLERHERNVQQLFGTPQPKEPEQEPVAWRDHVEQRLLTWRQSFVNKSGDQLALDDFMDKRSLDDLIDFVCDEYTTPPKRKPLTDELWDLLDAVEKELNRRAIPEAWLLVAHKAGRAYIEARGIKE